MHIESHALPTLSRQAMAAGLLVVLAVGGCSAPTDSGISDAPVTQLTAQYSFACGTWTPGPPPAERTVLDLRLRQEASATAPATELVQAIEAAGGRVVYRFHGPMVRAELDLAAVPELARPSGPVDYAVTVAEPSVHDVPLIVMLSHDLTEADLQAVETLGGQVTYEYHLFEGYAVVVDDSKVPEVRALPGVRSVSFDGMVCTF